ncbi:MAG: Lrp/AsnC family transcriptional regulator [Chloroflexi bacterium]|nr:Lrp/AsnC family transcriptional regulator [Chloroflexota bacterium]MBL7061603.1 Lrp/AsnC family transcriptional regulator [Dehalococcoidia bacterium]
MPIKIDNVDKNLLNIIQAEFPLSREPFAALELRLSVNRNEVIQRIESLKSRGIIRLIGPVFNPRRLGYRTTLVAMKVPVERLDKAKQIVSTHPMVSHCYERDHDFNLWFTLAMPVTEDIESEVHKLGSKIKVEEILNLPAVRIFKIGAYFNLGGSYASMPNMVDMVTHSNRLSNIDSEISPTDRAVINELQQDLPLNEKPFDLMSARLSIDVDKFLSRCQALLQCGIMRRFSAAVNHSKLGFTANAMACWDTPTDIIEAAGNKIAKFPEISHCYERQTSHLWPYNLFAMIHAVTKETCRAIVDRIHSETGLDKNGLVLLFSTKEIKKTRVRYTV